VHVRYGLIAPVVALQCTVISLSKTDSCSRILTAQAELDLLVLSLTVLMSRAHPAFPNLKQPDVSSTVASVNHAHAHLPHLHPPQVRPLHYISPSLARLLACSLACGLLAQKETFIPLLISQSKNHNARQCSQHNTTANDLRPGSTSRRRRRQSRSTGCGGRACSAGSRRRTRCSS
jgi:hypothetical protein